MRTTSGVLKESEDISERLEKRLEPVLVSQEQRKREKTYLWHEDGIIVPSDSISALLKWTHEGSGHFGVDRTLKPFKKWFHSTWSDDQLRKTLQPIVVLCPCWSCTPVLQTWGYRGQRSLFDPSYATLCQQCSLGAMTLP